MTFCRRARRPTSKIFSRKVRNYLWKIRFTWHPQPSLIQCTRFTWREPYNRFSPLPSYAGNPHPDKPDEFIPEVVKFSAQVIKINERGARQDRHLVCTDWQLHHFKTRARDDAEAASSSASGAFVADPGDYREAQRSVPLRCLTECVVSTASLQVVVQV